MIEIKVRAAQSILRCVHFRADIIRGESLTKSKRRGGGGFRSRQSEGRSKPANSGECETCGATLAPDARFCQRCGTPLPGTPALARTNPKRTSILIYSVAVVSVIGAMLVAVFLTYSNRGEQAPPAVENAAVSQPSTVDLSTMAPREAADRLFNRVMGASERGDTQEAAQFAPMAVAAYGRVTNLDADAHYHLGLLYLQLDELDQVREQIAIMRQNAPRHLLALLLEHEVASRAGDTEAAARAAGEFAASYGDEVATARPEYEAHRFAIDRFRAAGATPELGSVAAARPAAAEGGAALFERRCAECHGLGAKGTDKGPPLVHRIYEPSHHADAAFYLAVRQGVRAHHWPFGDMPAVEGVSDEQIARILAYVRGLQRAAGIE